MTRVLLLTTGGTIASRRGDQGLEPQISARGLLEYMSDLRAHYHIDARDILNLDSSNIQAEEWQTIARAVMENLDAYDGIVITHGTDTMAYTAAALSFLGLGVEAPAPEWGAMLSFGRTYIRDYSYLTYLPGLAMMITILSLNLLGDGLRDAMDPRLR